VTCLITNWSFGDCQAKTPNSELKHVLEDAIELFLGNREEKFQYSARYDYFNFKHGCSCLASRRLGGLVS
jgi:hypothetical protein